MNGVVRDVEWRIYGGIFKTLYKHAQNQMSRVETTITEGFQALLCTNYEEYRKRKKTKEKYFTYSFVNKQNEEKGRIRITKNLFESVLYLKIIYNFASKLCVK